MSSLFGQRPASPSPPPFYADPVDNAAERFRSSSQLHFVDYGEAAYSPQRAAAARRRLLYDYAGQTALGVGAPRSRSAPRGRSPVTAPPGPRAPGSADRTTPPRSSASAAIAEAPRPATPPTPPPSPPAAAATAAAAERGGPPPSTEAADAELREVHRRHCELLQLAFPRNLGAPVPARWSPGAAAGAAASPPCSPQQRCPGELDLLALRAESAEAALGALRAALLESDARRQAAEQEAARAASEALQARVEADHARQGQRVADQAALWALQEAERRGGGGSDPREVATQTCDRCRNCPHCGRSPAAAAAVLRHRQSSASPQAAGGGRPRR
eukprot:TRINITY_DN14818_c0_g1_i1.p1 TRINITY_DN14818_c0_g1~~TRINITY_DN14818_c0_g1_i1.p1  ORF type:complete len:356 (+),score=95.14 TRINITY_DN14818_c0_g1_i1:76-1068(+)